MLGMPVIYVLVRRRKERNKFERVAMNCLKQTTFLLAMTLSFSGLSGEIVYQDYLSESELLSAQDREADPWIITSCDWNYFFESNSLAVALRIRYGEGTNAVFRPIVVRYDFNGVHEPVARSVRRADTCFMGALLYGFCMVGLDSFLFSYGQRQTPKTAILSFHNSTQSVVDITRELNGMRLWGFLSASERAVFPDGGGFAFQCFGTTNDCSLLLWNRGAARLWPVRSRLRGYACLSGGRVLMDELDTSDLRTVSKFHSSPRTAQDRQFSSNLWVSESREYWKMNARCHQVLACRDADIEPNVYAEWAGALSNKIITLGKDVLGKNDWTIDMHGMEKKYSSSELGHEFVEGHDVLYDFHSWKIFRVRKKDSGWQVFDLRDFFSEDVSWAKDSVPMSVLHRGPDSCYYALLFESGKTSGGGVMGYRIRIVEVSRKGENVFMWSFPDFTAAKKLQTFESHSPGVVHKLQDDSWIFLSNTFTLTNDAVFVQRMTGSRKEIQPAFKSMDYHKGQSRMVPESPLKGLIK